MVYLIIFHFLFQLEHCRCKVEYILLINYYYQLKYIGKSIYSNIHCKNGCLSTFLLEQLVLNSIYFT